MIVIINGPLGVGKTETSWKLVTFFERAVMLDADYIGAEHPFEIYDSGRIERQHQAIRLLVEFYIQHGYHNFVINNVFEDAGALARQRHLLADLDDVIYAFRLTCDASEMERRIRKRAANQSTDSDSLAWELIRFRELAAIQDAAAHKGDMGFIVDTTHLDVTGVAQAIWDNIHERVELLPYNPEWPMQYQAELLKIKQALGPLALQIEHIGSTAIPGLDAKPVIDILVVVERLEASVACIMPLEGLGYAFIDYPQNTDRRFFRKGLPRTHHLHIVERGSPLHLDHVDFRDALRVDSELRAQYQRLKHDLAERYTSDRAAYSDSKGAFIKSVLIAYRSKRDHAGE